MDVRTARLVMPGMSSRSSAASLLLCLFSVCVFPVAAAVQTVEVRVNAGTDDAEEGGSSVSLSSSDLELTVDGVNQTVGMRFANVALPKGAQISKAYIQFQVDESSSTETLLAIHGEAADDAPTFSSADGDITSRPRTSASVAWSPPGWPTTGVAGVDQRTPDISAIIQEIVNRNSWASGNALVLIIDGDGNGKRVAESFNGDAGGAPLLHVEYGATPGNEVPSADAGEDRSLLLPEDTLCLTGAASDDGVPGPLGVNWQQVGGPDTVALENPFAYSTTATFPATGNYTLAFQAGDGELTATDDLQVTVGRRINVPGDAATIQAGVDMAGDGDIVIVAPGTYNENVSIASKTITLASRYYLSGDPADIEATVIDGGGGDFVVRFESDVGPASTVTGFHIRNGIDGVIGFAPINILYNHVTDSHDALEFKTNSGGLARGNILELNSDDGIDLNRETNLIAEQNLIRDNHGDGIEMRMNDYSGPTLQVIIRENMIINNEDDGVQLIDYDGYTPRVIHIERNVIAGNLMAGVGIMCCGNTHETYEGASALETVFVTNNVFDGNDHGVTGGDNLTARNNIFMNQTNIAVKNIDGDSSVAYNLFWNNGTDIVASNVDSGSTLFLDPMLDGNYYPLPGSSAIDTGVDVGLPYNGLAPDLGAFETPVNTAPVVDAGEDLLRSWSADPVPLSGLATDDSLPEIPGVLDISWTQLVGPCGVLIDDATAADTTATFAQPGRYRFRLSADDGELAGSDAVTVELLADNLPNRPPVANDDSAGTQEETAVIVDVAANDTDPDGNLDPGSTNTACATCSLPAGGTLQNHGDGSFTYTPQAGFTGNDGFVYEICDDEPLCDTATVTLMVTAVVQNRPPVANDDSATTAEETAVIIDIAANDTDPDGNLDPASTNTACATCSLPAGGTLQNHGDGTFTYTPLSGFTGDDSFVYEICDTGLLCDTATVTLTVTAVVQNRPPVANDDSATTAEETAVTVDVTANDTDADGNLDPASANTACATCSLPAGGTLQNHGNGTFTYTPQAGFTGDDGFIYEVCDTELLCDTATVTLTVYSATGSTEITVRVADGNDDAEEKASTGKVFLTSSDLELVDDARKGFDQVVGIRFASVPVPYGASIEAAYLQFQVDEVSTGAADLLVAAEASDHAAVFTNTRSDISSRATTNTVAWSPPDWTARGDAGAAQRTPDLADLVQQVVGRSGWRSGNAIAFVISGSGTRTAESYNGQADAAPLLYIRYSNGAGN